MGRPLRSVRRNGPTPDTPALGAEAITNTGEGNEFLHILHCNFALCCNFETGSRLNFSAVACAQAPRKEHFYYIYSMVCRFLTPTVRENVASFGA